MVPTIDQCYETLHEQRLLQCLEVIKAGAFRHIKEQARLDIVLQVLDRIHIVSALSEYDFNSISLKVLPAVQYQETSLVKNRMSRKAFNKQVTITITEGWNEIAQTRSLRADSNSCLAYTEGGMLGVTLPVLSERDMEIAEQRPQSCLQGHTNVLDVIDYFNPKDNQSGKLYWLTLTCPMLFQGEYRRQMEVHADTTKITEYGRIYLDDISRCLGIPSEHPELLFVLLPDSFRFYGSVRSSVSEPE